MPPPSSLNATSTAMQQPRPLLSTLPRMRIGMLARLRTCLRQSPRQRLLACALAGEVLGMLGLGGVLLIAPIGWASPKPTLPANLNPAPKAHTRPKRSAKPFLNALRQAGINPKHAALVIYQPDEDRYVVKHRAERLHPAASNTKLLTAYTALRVLGSQHQWRTPFWLVRHPRKSTNHSGLTSAQSPALGWSLWVRGMGDPSMQVADIAQLAQKLYQAGLTHLEGDIFLDSSHFEPSPNPPHWPKAKLWKRWAAPLSPFMVGQNVAKVYLTIPPQGLEQDANPCVDTPTLEAANPPVPNRVLEVLASSNVPTLQITARFASNGQPSKLQVLQRWNTQQGQIIITGNSSPKCFPMRLELALHQPALHFGLLLRHFLHQAGVRGASRAALHLGAPPATDKPLARVLYTQVSKPLGRILHLPLGLSSNVAAEAMLRETARAYRPHLTPPPRGALSAQEARTTYAVLLGRLLQVGQHQARLYDGSGLSPNNQVSALVLIKVLRLVWQNPAMRPRFLKALPALGVRGTLRWRRHRKAMRGRVIAKTGSLRGTSNVSGFMFVPKHSPVLFSFLLHQPGVRSAALQALQDQALIRIYALLQAMPAVGAAQTPPSHEPLLLPAMPAVSTAPNTTLPRAAAFASHARCGCCPNTTLPRAAASPKNMLRWHAQRCLQKQSHK